ncbi:MAG: DUF5060 domain-containing protein [Chloroflexota bacterium]
MSNVLVALASRLPSALLVLLPLALAVVLALVVVARAPTLAMTSIARWQVHEVSLTTGNTYANPFTDVVLEATLTDPNGQLYAVSGFYDGDGTGGQTGGVWKFRVSPPLAGVWSWRTTSNDAQLDGRSGTFLVTGSIGGRFAQGPIIVSPEAPRYFKHSEGPHVFLAGKFLEENLAAESLRYSHVLPSSVYTDANRDGLLARHAAMGLNKMNLYVANRGDYGRLAVTPWLGSAQSNDRTRFDLAHWRQFESWVERLLNEGLVAEIWFFADDSDFGSLPRADRERLLEYTMARISAYANTMFVHSLEWQEGFSAAEVESDIRFLRAHNPWARLVSVHGLSGSFRFPNASWADFMATQAGFNRGHAAVNAFALRQRALAAKPHLLEELAYGKETTEERKETWAAFVGGSAGVGTGSYLKPLAAFASATRFYLMEPDNALLVYGSGYVLARPGEEYIVYLPDGWSATLDLSAVTDTLSARWYDPRSGAYQAAGAVSGAGRQTFTAPDARDWVLYLASAAGTTGPLSGGERPYYLHSTLR